ncbi:hypothetical protein [Phreatobacter sp.]|uniref:hypothetical protein n=1 Tax=Phreatobacter sp. TaxID=1966341 RepID=UPI003F706929
MTNHDPREPRRADADPIAPEARRTNTEPPLPVGDPRFDRSPGNRWMVIGGIAAALILVIVVMSMLGSSGTPTVRAPEAQRPPVAQGTPAVVPPPAADPGTTGSVPPAQPIQPAPPPQTPAQQP